MEQKIREIVATFIRVPADQIGPSTPIDRSAVQSSILLHRMYARIAEEGLVVENYAAVKVFGDLSRFSGDLSQSSGDLSALSGNGQNGQDNGRAAPAAIGIDIEEIAALPRTTDFRKEEFYKMNFTAGEIAYCILQPDPFASFAGLFAAKEAIVKADGSNRNKMFNTLEIDHSPEGKPLYPGYGISIAHSGGMAVAVATSLVQRPAALPVPMTGPSAQDVPADKKTGPGGWIIWLALLIAVSALLIAILR